MFILVFIAPTCIYIYQDVRIFRGEKLPNNYIFEFPIPFEEIYIDVENCKLHGLIFYPPKNQNNKRVLLYFHGNAGNIASWGSIVINFAQIGFISAILDYRGYGKSRGKIKNEKNFIMDAIAFFDTIYRKFPDSEFFIYGRSLGSVPACALLHFRNKLIKKCVLETPIFNMQTLIKDLYHIPLPKFLIKYKFPNDFFVKNSTVPIQIFHGTSDKVVPLKNCLRFKNIRDNIEINIINGASHNTIPDYPEYWEKLKTFLSFDSSPI